jgi:hypothetical protein
VQRNLEKARRGWERKQNRTFPKRKARVVPVPDNQRSARTAPMLDNQRSARAAPIPDNHRSAGGASKRRTIFKSVGFEWNPGADWSFRSVRAAILNNASYRGDPTRQYHLSYDASQYIFRGVLFQLVGEDPGMVLSSSKLIDEVRLVQSISKKFLDAKTHYHTTEWEALAIVRYLEEVRWLVNDNLHQKIVYTDHECLKTALKNHDKGWIVGWQLRLSEYDLQIMHVKEKENVLDDGLSRLPVNSIPFGKPGKEESWADTMAVSDKDARMER